MLTADHTVFSDVPDPGYEFHLDWLDLGVNWRSLRNLMINYRVLINRRTFEDTRDLLQTMIEDVRQLCTQSPTLFEMYGRPTIIHSPGTRYGVRQGREFKTLTTSRGIKEIISLSAAFYNSLYSDYTDISI